MNVTLLPSFRRPQQNSAAPQKYGKKCLLLVLISVLPNRKIRYSEPHTEPKLFKIPKNYRTEYPYRKKSVRHFATQICIIITENEKSFLVIEFLIEIYQSFTKVPKKLARKSKKFKNMNVRA
jgi:hypothetical protein